jgi:tripartite-type tricarboxylate transporter receptor subunit TctC
MALIKQGWAAALLAMAALPLSTSAGAQGAQSTQGSQVNYPTKPIRVVVPFSAGSATDILSRMIGPKLYEAWGQQVVTDNRPSAGGTVAGGIVASAAPDGYTLLLTSSAFAGSAALYDQLPYDTVRDFAGITQIASTPLVIVASPSLGLKSLKDLIALAKQKPKFLNFASSGIGSGTHYGSELFNYSAGISATHVPYKGVPEAMNDTMTGRTQYFVAPTLAVIPLLKSGRLQALAVTPAQRIVQLPEVPTVAEAALPGFEYDGWYGFVAPAKTPRAVVLKLNAAIVRILESTEIREKLLAQGAVVRTGTPEAFEKLIREEIVTRRKIFQAAGAKPL